MKINKSQTKIAFVARTIGLEYDDRIRKECITLTKQNVEVFIYVNFADNREEEGITSYGIPYKSFKLKSREVLPSAKYLLIKSIDFYLSVRKYLKDYNLIWAHEEYAYLFPLLVKKDKCIWDLHEIPFRFEKKGMKSIFHYIENRSKKIIHANEDRIEYLKLNGTIKYPEKHVYINNLPDKEFLFSNDIDDEYSKFKKWLGDSQYVYLQGLAVSRRHPLNTIEAVMHISDMKAVVVGEFDEEAFKILEKKYPDTLKERIYFRGMVDQLSIPEYLKNAFFSIILYDMKTANNMYCEPNRLYQSIILGVPVVVGCNKPMKNLVDKNNFGVSLNSDGKNLDELNKGIKNLVGNYPIYLTNVVKNSQFLIWNDKNIKKDWYL